MIITDENKFGLTQEEREIIFKIFRTYPEIKQVNIYGSRAKGNWKAGSDIDLVILDENISSETLWKLKEAFEDSLLPYFVGLQLLSELPESDYKSHIERVGQPFYRH